MKLPPNVTKEDRIILFDGVCKLCNAWSNFIIKYDRDYRFILCSVQSVGGQKILNHFGFPTEYFETMLYVENGQCFQKSDAFFKIMKVLGKPWCFVTIFSLLPRAFRNWLYDRIALNRYLLFGKYDYCQLPIADHKRRYLDERVK